MATRAIVGGSSVSVLSLAGQQFGIPLSLLAVKDDDSIDTSRLSATVAAAAASSLGALYRSGAIEAGTASAPVLAMTIRAKVAGSTGNAISLSFANVVPDTATPADSRVDVTIAYQDRRPGLTVASIGAQLGTPAGGIAPGLVALKAPASKMPAAMAGTKLSGSPLELAVAAEDGAGDAFTVTAPGADPLLADVTVAIEDVNTGAGTFTLSVGLDNSQAGVKLGDLDGKLGLLVDVVPSPGGFAPPAPGQITLAGGADAQASAPQAAEASVLSS